MDGKHSPPPFQIKLNCRFFIQNWWVYPKILIDVISNLVSRRMLIFSSIHTSSLSFIITHQFCMKNRQFNFIWNGGGLCFPSGSDFVLRKCFLVFAWTWQIYDLFPIKHWTHSSWRLFLRSIRCECELLREKLYNF
jgi:hypothetical protein